MLAMYRLLAQRVRIALQVEQSREVWKVATLLHPEQPALVRVRVCCVSGAARLATEGASDVLSSAPGRL